MGALMRSEDRGGEIVHVSTGKLKPAGEEHKPVWGEWLHEYAYLEMRQCRHPDCDLDDWRKVTT